jgi:hypothetical protein
MAEAGTEGAGAVAAAAAGAAAAPVAGAAGNGALTLEALAPEIQETIARKGWTEALKTSPVDFVNTLGGAYRGLESKVGSDTIVAPKQGAPLGEFFKQNGPAFGLPETAEAYKIEPPEKLPEGLAWDDKLAGALGKAAFEAGAPPALVSPLVQAYHQYMGEQYAAAVAADAAQRDKDMATLRAAWGPNFAANVEHAGAAVRVMAKELGLKTDQEVSDLVGAVSTAMGNDAMATRAFHLFAKSFGEDALREGTIAAGIGMSADQIKAKRAEMQKLPAYGNAADAEHDRVIQEFSRLGELLHKLENPRAAA